MTIGTVRPSSPAAGHGTNGYVIVGSKENGPNRSRDGGEECAGLYRATAGPHSAKGVDTVLHIRPAGSIGLRGYRKGCDVAGYGTRNIATHSCASWADSFSRFWML